MSPTKVYAVFLFEPAVEELGGLVSSWLRRSEVGSCIYAKMIEPNGSYFHRLIEHAAPDGGLVEVELQIPHGFVKAVFYGADSKTLGFV